MLFLKQSDGEEMILVSVIVITYNSEKYVIETLESVKRQDYKKIELIISDDCSTDNTMEIVSKWIEVNEDRFENIKVVQTKSNKGVTYNCNLGLNKSNGVFIQFIAGDDVLYDNAISRKIEYAIQNKLKVVYSKITVFGASSQSCNQIDKICNRGYNILSKEQHYQYKEILKSNYIVGPAGSFFLRGFLVKLGGFDNRFPMLEDYPLHLKIIESGVRIELFDQHTVMYRVSNSSLSTLKNPRYINSYNHFIYKVLLKRLFREKMFKYIYLHIIESIIRKNML